MTLIMSLPDDEHGIALIAELTKDVDRRLSREWRPMEGPSST